MMLMIVRKVPTQVQAVQTFDGKYVVWMNPEGRCNWNVQIEGRIYPVGYDKSISPDSIAINGNVRRELGISIGHMVHVVFPNETLHVMGQIDLNIGQEGVTVRRGTKWHGYCSNRANFNLCECEVDIIGEEHITHNVVGLGRVVEFGLCAFKDIPARIVEMEHCADSRTYGGLLHAMKNVYYGFNENEQVSWVRYVRVQ